VFAGSSYLSKNKGVPLFPPIFRYLSDCPYRSFKSCNLHIIKFFFWACDVTQQATVITSRRHLEEDRNTAEASIHTPTPDPLTERVNMCSHTYTHYIQCECVARHVHLCDLTENELLILFCPQYKVFRITKQAGCIYHPWNPSQPVKPMKKPVGGNKGGDGSAGQTTNQTNTAG